MKISRLYPSAVFLLAFCAFTWNLRHTSISSGWIDPILHYGAQDEATYTRQAIHMVTQGDWMTPTMLGRWVFEKPPLLMWLSALSMKLFKIGPFPARLPTVLAGALIVSLCFAIARAVRSAGAGLAAALLCLSNPVLFTMARHNMTDILVAAATMCALAALLWDSSLDRRSSRVMFVLAIAAAIMTKSIAGLLPAFAALLFAAVCANRPLLGRVAFLTGLAIVLASPWFVYNLIAHRQWFLADQGFQILTIGLNPQRTSPGNHLTFYLIRCLYAAPVAVALAITGLPALVFALRRREPVAVLLTCFLAVFCAALLIFRFHSVTYLTPVFPILILIAAVSSPLLKKSFALPMAVAITIVFVGKAANPDEPWGISYRAGSTVPATATLSQYCQERRGNDLYILGIEDQFYSLVLPLARVRYGWVDSQGAIAGTRPHLAYLGIVQDADAVQNTELYASRLRAWGFNSTQPLATGIIGRTVDDLVSLILAHRESDFLISPAIASRLGGRESQQTRVVTPDYVLLESRESHPAGPPSWTCSM